MTKLSACMLVLMTVSVCNAASIQAEFYVSPQGSDAWSGTLAEPNAQGTDRPFATLERARDAVRDLNNRAVNNIVADVLAPPRGYYLSLREGPLKDAVIQRNIFYSVNRETVFIDELAPGKGIKTEDSRGRALARAKDADTDCSIHYCAVDPTLGKSMLHKQQADGVDAISKNGIVMLNIALKGDGTIPEKQIAYLTAFGDFLKINGEGIYGTRPWKTFGEGPLKVKDGRQGENHAEFSQKDIRFTTKDGVLYAFVLAPPTEDIVIKTLATGGLLDREIAGIELMGSSEQIKWNRSADALTIQLPQSLPGQIVNGFRIQSK